MALIAAGVLAVAQFASGGDRVANAAQVTGTTPPTPRRHPRRPHRPSTVPADSEAPDDRSPDDTADLDGKIVIQIGDGDPIVIDLGDLGSLATSPAATVTRRPRQDRAVHRRPAVRPRPRRRARRALAARLRLFGDGDDLTVAGPDGLSVLDFGEGDGSVTITKQDGEITITSEGDVQVDDLTAPDVSAPLPSLPSLPDFDQIYQCLEDATG